MPGASRCNLDTAGGTILEGGQYFVFVENKLWAVVGDDVADHGSGPHNAATMVQGSTFVSINGTPVVLAGHAASCGHTATGSLAILVDS